MRRLENRKPILFKLSLFSHLLSLISYQPGNKLPGPLFYIPHPSFLKFYPAAWGIKNLSIFSLYQRITFITEAGEQVAT